MEIITNKQNTKQFIADLRETTINFPAETIEKARNFIENNEVPTTRDEAWKYTRLSRLSKSSFSTKEVTVSDISNYKINAKSERFVFVNGIFNSSLSELSSDIEFDWKLLSECSQEDLLQASAHSADDLFEAINTLYLNDGLLLNIRKGSDLSRIIHVIHILDNPGAISNFRLLLNTGESSSSEIIESFVSFNATDSFTNNITKIEAGANSKITFSKLQTEAESNFHISTEHVNQKKDSIVSINTITLNGGLVRNNINVDVLEENCESNLNGAYLLRGNQHVDNHTCIDHQVANCISNETYKGVIDEKATAVFNGKVFVRKDAQHINAFQSNGNVLLSDDATVNSKPELEIYANDVKCSHGSTTGQLDEEAVFYLRSRGISEKSARHLLVAAFIGDVLEKIKNEAFLEKVRSEIQSRFKWDL